MISASQKKKRIGGKDAAGAPATFFGKSTLRNGKGRRGSSSIYLHNSHEKTPMPGGKKKAERARHDNN